MAQVHPVDIVQFSVGRIESVTVSERTFKIQANFNMQKLLADRFGRFIHSEKNEPINVHLLFAPELAGYISEKTWHSRQSIKPRRGGMVELCMPVPDIRQQFSLWHSVVSEHVIPSEVEGSPFARNTFG